MREDRVAEIMIPAIRARNTETEVMEYVTMWSYGLTPEDKNERIPY